jgi:hypothetical protein
VLLEGLVATGARTSKRNLYRPVDPRPPLGLPVGIARAYGASPVGDTSH